MTAADQAGPEQFRLLATHLAGRAVAVATAPAGEPAYTNGTVVFVSAGRPLAAQRGEVVVQSALLGAGSLDRRLVGGLRARPSVARRYLALEGRRVLAGIAGRVPVTATLGPYGEPSTRSAAESLAVAKSRARVVDPPEWFGTIAPARLLGSDPGRTGRATDQDLAAAFDGLDRDEDGDEEPDESGGSRVLRLFDNPVFDSQVAGNLLRRILGSSRGTGNESAGAQLRARSLRRGRPGSAEARPLPTRIEFVDDDAPAAALGFGGALYPEWDVHTRRYRPDWCRVLDFPLTVEADISAAAVAHDGVLARRLARVGLGPKVRRGRPEGDELDLEAAIDLLVDLRSGYTPAENVYLETRKLDRNLGVLVLVDASGSTSDADPDGLAVHEHHRRAAATLAATLEELGDRVAVYAFRSEGRGAVHLPAIKTFGQRFGAAERARLQQLQPSGYTRLGAGIRGAGRILDSQAGTPYRLLVVLSDGVPYDHGYESRYAEADVRKALGELRDDGIACLCLSLGASTETDALDRVFGSAGHANAAALSELSPRMDELFLASLRELSAPRTRGR
ncbi:nitric oxide reductase activation protein NorD [Nocardia sp. CA-290969]|uniref:nitric oxide reductase activation protein NorD n=1 Tax=Nocardia sp. CA-290969 TaxID=3239986 RepID=UPI003D939BEA